MKALLRSFSIVLLMVSGCVQAQVYECVDANGKKSFAKECPVGTVKFKEIHPDVISPGAPVVPTDKYRGLNDVYERRRAEDNARAAQQDQQAEDARNSARACADAKARLEALQSGRQSKRVDPITGEHVPMDDATRQSEIAGLNKDIADNCR